MAQIVNMVGIYVAIVISVISIDWLIGRFFLVFEKHQKKANEEAVKVIKELFNDFPKMMERTIKSAMKAEKTAFESEEE